MIRKLRMRFIAAAMAALLIVLTVIFGIVGVINYKNITGTADDTLEILKENGGEFPTDETGQSESSNSVSSDSSSVSGGADRNQSANTDVTDAAADSKGAGSENTAGQADSSGSSDRTLSSGDSKNGKPSAKPDAKKAFPADKRMSPELPYESRYFYAVLSESGDAISVSTVKIAAVDSEQAAAYAKEAAEKSGSRGFLNSYRYIKYTDDGRTTVIFLDCSRDLDSFRSFTMTGIGVSAAGLLTVLLLLVFLSRRIVRPFAENYEKQKRFITDAGHELKTPLAVISADAEVLEMDIGQNEWISDIKSQTERMAELTKNLIRLSRMEEEQPQTEMIEFPVSDVVSEAVDSFKALAKTQNKSLESSIQPMLSMTGDEKTISQLVSILLDNAVKYTDGGGMIKVALEKQRNTIKLSVFNTADSIPRENIGHMFDRFYRMDQSRNSGTGGYGLGLSIASAIVSAHKGKIAASTNDEKSLLIVVTFPA